MCFCISTSISARGSGYLSETEGRGQICTSEGRYASRYAKTHVILFISLVSNPFQHFYSDINELKVYFS